MDYHRLFLAEFQLQLKLVVAKDYAYVIMTVVSLRTSDIKANFLLQAGSGTLEYPVADGVAIIHRLVRRIHNGVDLQRRYVPSPE